MVEEVAREIEEEAFDAWCFDKTTKQYQGAFFPDECKAIIRADREAVLRRVEDALDTEELIRDGIRWVDVHDVVASIAAVKKEAGL